MLHQICAAADRVAEYAATIARDGPTIRTKAGLRTTRSCGMNSPRNPSS